MDAWVALAAAGARYVAKHLKNFQRDGERDELIMPESPTSLGHLVEKSCYFQKLARIKKLEEENASKEVINPNYGSESRKVLSVSSLSSGYSENECNPIIAEESGRKDEHNENTGNLSIESPMTKICSPYDINKNSSLRSRRAKLQMVKPLTSLESCLVAQLYNDRAGMEEYVLSCSPLPSPSVRPFVVTDGRRIIRRGGTSRNKLHKQISFAENSIAYGVPSLPYNLPLEVSRRKIAKGNFSSSGVKAKHSNTLSGSSSGALLFGLGVSVGLVSSLIANKREVDKLNSMLKQTESLVQDLQDELEMKDSLTVKELAVEDFESQDANDESYRKRPPHSSSSEHNLDAATEYNGEEVHDQREEKDLESMSKIEAELEAELEKLEMDMTSSSLERRLSDLLESDPDFVPGISQCELRADMFGKQISDQPYADQDGSGSSTPNPANFSVSPRELTLRIRELIQTRLEERVKELETALEISERKFQIIESEQKLVMRNHWDSESRSSATAIEEQNLVDQPVIINLSGEALNAYNEACDELTKASAFQEIDLEAQNEEKDQSLPLAYQSVSQDQSGRLNQCDERFVNNNDVVLPSAESTLDWQISLGDIGFSGTESESDDELEKLLIKQIVEKNRRNSSVILNVERKLFED